MEKKCPDWPGLRLTDCMSYLFACLPSFYLHFNGAFIKLIRKRFQLSGDAVDYIRRHSGADVLHAPLARHTTVLAPIKMYLHRAAMSVPLMGCWVHAQIANKSHNNLVKSSERQRNAPEAKCWWNTKFWFVKVQAFSRSTVSDQSQPALVENENF